MNSKILLYVVLFLLMAAAIVCHLQVILKPKFTFISMSGTTDTPDFLHDVRSYALDAYLPKVTAKALANLEISQALEAESIYKIVIPEAFDPSHIDNCVTLSTLDVDSKFIHAAMGEQVDHILEKFFKDASAVLLLELDPTALKNSNITLKKEQNKADGEYFPHLYATTLKIPLATVKTIIELKKKDGKLTIDTLSIVVPNSL